MYSNGKEVSLSLTDASAHNLQVHCYSVQMFCMRMHLVGVESVAQQQQVDPCFSVTLVRLACVGE